MVTDDKVGTADRQNDIENNHNMRDQARVGIWTLVVAGLFLLFLVAMGMSHAPQNAQQSGQPMEALSGQAPANGKEPEAFSVRQPVGEVELPGTVGQPQTFLSGRGNTPVPSQGQSIGTSPNTATDQQSLGKAQSGSTPSDAMKTGANYANGMESGKGAAGTSGTGGPSNASGPGAAPTGNPAFNSKTGPSNPGENKSSGQVTP